MRVSDRALRLLIEEAMAFLEQNPPDYNSAWDKLEEANEVLDGVAEPPLCYRGDDCPSHAARHHPLAATGAATGLHPRAR